MIIDYISDFCVRHGIIRKEDLPMFRYCVEKRFYSIVVFLPLVVLGIMWTNVATTVAFLGAFSYLRSTTNGFHAKKSGACFIYSILIEFILFRYVIPFLTPKIVIISLIISLLIIMMLAPYNHPNMALTSDEILACRTVSRKRTVHLLIIFLVSTLLSWDDVSVGLLLGIALVSVLLCLAYISNWEELKCLAKKRRT